MQKLSASIVVYKNDPAVLERTILSFQNSTLSGRLIVVDNSPTDNARVLCQRLNVEYIFNNGNIGFGKAHNLAIVKCLDQSAYHLVLNPDVYFDADVLQKLYLFMEEHSQAGLVMPKVLYPDGSLQRLCKLLPKPWNLFSRRFIPFESWIRKSNDRYEMISSGYDHNMEVPFLSGCFMFLRTSVLKTTGLFDERFFLYAEDADLSRRIHKEAKTMYFPYSEIYHVHERGSYKNLKLTLRNLISACKYFSKWGWFFDAERKRINETASISSYQYRHLDLARPAEPAQETAL